MSTQNGTLFEWDQSVLCARGVQVKRLTMMTVNMGVKAFVGFAHGHWDGEIGPGDCNQEYPQMRACRYVNHSDKDKNIRLS